jgi:XTP/dITP diphosphohydrolase
MGESVGASPGTLKAIADFVDLVDILRRECPWDAEQTHTSLRPHLLEEAHEVLEALDNLDEVTGDGIEHVCEELGDLLFQVVFHARIAAESGHFDLADVAQGIHDKLHHRHPHVFGADADADDGAGGGSGNGPGGGSGNGPGGGAGNGPGGGSGNGPVPGTLATEQVLATWEQIKREEKGRESVLDGIPATLPALARAAKTLRRASSVGLAPEPPAEGPADDEALGDALLDLVAWARGVGLDPEEALRGAVARLADQVRAAEAGAAAEDAPDPGDSPDVPVDGS